jgi:hypothetical protein
MSKEVESTPNNTMERMLELQLKREEREAKEQARADAERAEIASARQAKIDNRVKKDRDALAKKFRVQVNCTHEKGKAGIPRTDGAKFYNIYAHRFPGGQICIACRNQCGMRWWQGDTREWLIRDGKRVKNHTGKSFADMWKLLPNDAFSSSEVAMKDPTLENLGEEVETI